MFTDLVYSFGTTCLNTAWGFVSSWAYYLLAIIVTILVIVMACRFFFGSAKKYPFVGTRPFEGHPVSAETRRMIEILTYDNPAMVDFTPMIPPLERNRLGIGSRSRSNTVNGIESFQGGEGEGEEGESEWHSDSYQTETSDEPKNIATNIAKNIPKAETQYVRDQKNPDNIQFVRQDCHDSDDIDIDIKDNLPSFDQIMEEHCPLSGQTAKNFRSYPEFLTCKAAEEVFNAPFYSARPNFLLNTMDKTGRNLEVDCYNEELGIGLEYNGDYHYKYPHRFNPSLEKFKGRVAKDTFKVEKFDENGKYLITVPYNVANSQIKDYIEYYHPERVKERLGVGVGEGDE